MTAEPALHRHQVTPVPAKLPKLLLVEDEAIVAMDMAQQLGDLGYEIVGIADNGAEALRLVRQHRPDLVLMDVVIKGSQDGIQTAEQINAGPLTPVVFLTAFNDQATVHRAALTAPYGYVTKPYQIRELRAAIDVALYKSALERQLKVSERWFASTLRCVGDGVIAFDGQGRVQFLNPAAERVLGLTLDQAVGRAGHEVVRFAGDSSPTTALRLQPSATELLLGRRLIGSDGQTTPVDASVAPIVADDGALLGSVCALRDVTGRVEAETLLRRSEERFRTAFDLAPVGMALVAIDGSFLQANAALLRLLRCDEGQVQQLRLQDITLPNEQHDEEARLRDLLSSRSPFLQFEKRYRAVNGQVLWALVSVSLLRRDEMAMCYLYQIHDISARKQTEQQLLAQAHRDELTGLPNRPALTQEMRRWLGHGYRRGRGFAVLFIDLDYFKQANDTYGHACGDQILQVAAQRMQGALRDSDLIGRWGGDEFVALIDNVASADDVASVARKLMAQFEAPILLERHGSATLGLSLGIALYPSDGEDAEVLLHRADEALYRAKAEGRGQLCFYAAGINTRLRQRYLRAQELNWAMDDMALRIVCPPPPRRLRGTLLHLPAALSWIDPAGRTWSEDEVRELAQESGLDQRLDEWLLRRVCTEAAAQGTEYAMTGISVRVSRQSLRAGTLPALIRHALDDSRLAPQRLCIEVSANLFGTEDSLLLRTLHDIQALQVGIAISDFGASPVSPQALQHLAPTLLCLSPTLLPPPAPNHVTQTLLTGWVSLGHGLLIPVAAREPVTPAWQALLDELGCELIPSP